MSTSLIALQIRTQENKDATKERIIMITSVEINGYRLLHEFSADLGPLTVIIGANATGKSTFIEFLRGISLSMDFPIADAMPLSGVLTASENTTETNWKLTFKKPGAWERSQLASSMEFVYEVSLGLERDSGRTLPLYECVRNGHPHPGYSTPLLYLQARGERCHVYDLSKGTLVPFDQAVPPSEDAPAHEATELAIPDDLAQMQKSKRKLRLAQIQFPREFPQLFWTRIFFQWIGYFPGFDVSRQSALRTRPAEIKPHTALEPEGGNLGTVLHDILTRGQYQAVAEQMRQIARAAYPFIEDIFAETTFGTPPQILVRVRESGCNRMMELWELSDGVLRFLCLTAALLSPTLSPVVLVDEPESGLHPGLLPVVADLIKLASESRQVIITTHSPELLNRFTLDEVAVIRREGARAQWFRPGTRQSLRTMLEGVQGETLGDLHRSGELEAVS